MLPTWYPALVALHIIFMVTYFSGTFYLVRLFVLHRQALALWEPDRGILAKQYGKMERTLLYIVSWPSLLLLVGFGAWMVWLQPGLLAEPWMQAKLGLTALVAAYQVLDHRIYKKLARGERIWHTYALRAWVQGSVLLLFALVFVSSFRSVQWYWGLIGLGVLAALLLVLVRMFSGGKDTGGAQPMEHASTGESST